MAQFCSRCGVRVEDAAAIECPSCKAPLSAPTPTASSDVAACTVCGRSVLADQLVQYQDQRVCPDCKPAFFQRMREGIPGAPSVVNQGLPIPFEAAPGIGSFFATLKAMITAPLQTLRGQKTGEGLEAAIAFWLIIQIPVQFLNAFAQWGLHHIMPRQQSPELPPSIPPFIRQLVAFTQMLQSGSLALQLGIAAAAVIFGMIWLFIFAGLTHGFLRLFGGGSQGYKTTVKAFCYAVAPAVFILVPCCGGCVAGVWMLVLNLLLIGPAHREEIGVGAGAYLCALLVSCLCIGGMWVIGGATLFALIAPHAH